ncbi:XkdX family protein [Desulfosporosinus fructosivorans]|uniref:XkdX family protein n=1 Tax=Desulfosporosinus fructosivorans TaxID=2018669 RepID=A0A4Z0QZH9_9FIRM|nr:XkdX family protein [Desulfosporosinus fructosivorans]TGE35864.1 XkdX family protein [Desulfosporosinus fructosivorans]
MVWFDRIKKFYDTFNRAGERLWSKEMVADGVVAVKVTPEQYFEITGEVYVA